MSQKLKKQIRRLYGAQDNLKQRIAQSMRSTGPFDVTRNCKSLQRELAEVNKTMKRKKKKLRSLR